MKLVTAALVSVFCLPPFARVGYAQPPSPHLETAVTEIDVKRLGALGDGIADDTAAFEAAIKRAAGHLRVIKVPAGRYKITRTLLITTRGLRFVGDRHGRPTQEGGSRLEFHGTGPLIQLGTENLRVAEDAEVSAGSTALTSPSASFSEKDVGGVVAISRAGKDGGTFVGALASVVSDTQATLAHPVATAVRGARLQVHPYDSGEFSGVQGLSLENLSLSYNGARETRLRNGMGSYGTGTFGLRDFRGGDVTLKAVEIEHFQYGFWGVQSDINNADQIIINYCSTGVYLGPRCDQNSWGRVYTLFNDTALEIDTARHARFTDCQFVDDGSAATFPVVINSNSGVSWPSEGSVFTRCWFEHERGAPVVPAFVGIGLTGPAALLTRHITFRDCACFVRPRGTIRAATFARIGNADAVEVASPWGSEPGATWFEFVGPSSPTVLLEAHASQVGRPAVKGGTGRPLVEVRSWGKPARP